MVLRSYSTCLSEKDPGYPSEEESLNLASFCISRGVIGSHHDDTQENHIRESNANTLLSKDKLLYMNFYLTYYGTNSSSLFPGRLHVTNLHGKL